MLMVMWAPLIGCARIVAGLHYPALGSPPANIGWEPLAHMQHVISIHPEMAYTVRHQTLLDQLQLTFELLNEWRGAEPELPSNVIPFRPRRPR